MKTPTFDADGIDEATFAPFVLEDQRESEDPDVRLAFYDFELFDTLAPEAGEMNGNEMGEMLCDWIEENELVHHSDGTHSGGYLDNCEGSACYFHFNHVEDAIRVAEYCIALFKDPEKLQAAMGVPERSGEEDGEEEDAE